MFASACGSSTQDMDPNASTRGDTSELPVASEPPASTPPPSFSVFRPQLGNACLIDSGDLWCWRSHWKPGDGQRVALPAKPVSVAGRCALLETGAVACADPGAPAREIAALEGVSALGSSDGYTCGIAEGKVLCVEPDGERLLVRGISDAVDLALAPYVACAIRAGGTVTCWGWPNLPVVVEGVRDIVQVSVDNSTGCGRTRAGKVVCWYKEDAQKVGVRWLRGKEIEGIEGATAIAAGTPRSCALVDGAVLCWGNPFDRPFKLQGIENAVALALGDVGCVRQADGKLKCWANTRAAMRPHDPANPVWRSNIPGAHLAKFGPYGPIVLSEAGTLEFIDPVWRQRVPQLAQVSDIVDFEVAHAKADALCVLSKTKGWGCWQADGSWLQLLRPEADIQQISHDAQVGGCGLKTDGELVCTAPDGFKVPLEAGLGNTLDTLVDVAVGTGQGHERRHVCVVDRKGELRCFGNNSWGELGQGHGEESREFLAPKGVQDVVEIDSEGPTTCARTRAGRVWCWGGWAEPVGLPRDVGVDGAIQIAVSDELGCARVQAGVRCWAWNFEAGEYSSYEVPGLAGVSEIRVDNGRVCGVEGAEVRCWWSGVIGEVPAPFMTLPIDITLPAKGGLGAGLRNIGSQAGAVLGGE